jgi:hypothetical protein
MRAAFMQAISRNSNTITIWLAVTDAGMGVSLPLANKLLGPIFPADAD